jgi:predicted nucleotide-binding protein
MPTPPVTDQEFVVHLFAPLDGPQAPAAYAQLQRIWLACRSQLGMSGQITGLPGDRWPSLEALGQAATDSVLATQESHRGVRQAVLRQAHDALNLSMAVAQPAPEGRHSRAWGRLAAVGPATPPQRRLGWADYAALWAKVSQPQAGALLGEAQVFLARTPPGKTGRVAATAELGQALDSLLPYREDRPGGWWRWGTTTTAGYALWDTGLATDTSAVREIVLVAAADRDEELSAWAWSDRTPAMPPFARYLMHAAKLRYEARLLERWRSTTSPGQDIDPLVAEANATLLSGKPTPEGARLLSSLSGRLRVEETRLTLLEADMARLAQTVSIAQRNLGAQPGCDAGGTSTGIFSADKSLARFLDGQLSSDRSYLHIELNRAKSVRVLVTEALDQLDKPRGEPGAAEPGRAAAVSPEAAAELPGNRASSGQAHPSAPKRVFVVYGRDGALARSFFDLLYTVGLEPLEWEKLVRPTGMTAPYLGDVVRNAPHLAQATLVLLSPDDIVELHPDLRQDNDHPYERARAGQARPNVLFELGLAFMAYPRQTIIVEVGLMRPIADLAGLNVIRFDGSAIAIKKVVDRLTLAGCLVDTSGADWLDPGRFASLAAYRRGPGTGEAARDG